MRFAALFLLVIGCKAGEVSTSDQPGLAKPVESDRSQPLPGEGAASPTTRAETPIEIAHPSDTPAAANTEADDPWPATSEDPWAPAMTKDESVIATPMLQEDKTETDPWAPASNDPWAPAAKTKKPIKKPIR